MSVCARSTCICCAGSMLTFSQQQAEASPRAGCGRVPVRRETLSNLNERHECFFSAHDGEGSRVKFPRAVGHSHRMNKGVVLVPLLVALEPLALQEMGVAYAHCLG